MMAIGKVTSVFVKCNANLESGHHVCDGHAQAKLLMYFILYSILLKTKMKT